MVATTAAPCGPKTFDIAGGDLILQVCSNSRHGQIVRLKAPKCTIGSAANCTLRLRARGVAPLHCLILRGPGGAAVRRWSPDTLLNHQAFDDAPLAPGDRLSVGPVELEVLSSGSGENWVAPAPWVQRLPLRQLPDPEVAAEREQLETQRAAVELQRQQWQTERAETERLLHEQNEELNNRLTALDAQLAELDAQRAALAEERRRWESERDEHMAAAAQLEQIKPQTAELHAQRKALEEDRLRWQAERTEAERLLHEQNEELNNRLTALDAQLAELDAQRAALAEERRRWESERDERMAAAAQLEQIKPQTAELDAQRKALEEDRLRWQAERAETERLLHEQNEDLNNRLTALDAQLAALDARSADLDARIAELATRQATLDADRAQFQEERSRWQQQQEQAASPRPAAAELLDEPAEPEFQESVKTTPNPPKHAADGDEEESVGNYMSRLLDRIRSSAGDSGPSTYAPPKSEPRRPAGDQPAAAEVARPQIIAQAQKPIERREPVEMSPRAAAPESRVNMSALRELANLSARAAIDRHARRTLIRTMYSKLVVAVVAFLSGAALLWMWDSMQAGNQTFYSSLAALLIAIFWGLEYAILTGRLFVSKSGRIDWNSSPHRKHPSLAAEDDASENTSPADADPAIATDPAAAVDSASLSTYSSRSA